MSRKSYDIGDNNVEGIQNRQQMSGNKRSKRKPRKPRNKRQGIVEKTKENEIYHGTSSVENTERTPSEITKHNELTEDISKGNNTSYVKRIHQIETDKFSDGKMINNSCPKWSATKYPKQNFDQVQNMYYVSPPHSSNDSEKYSGNINNHKGTTFYHKNNKKMVKCWKNKYRLPEMELSNGEHQFKNLSDLDKTKQYLNTRLSKYPKLSESHKGSPINCKTKPTEIDDKLKKNTSIKNQERQFDIIQPILNTADIGKQWDHVFAYCYSRPHKQNDELQTSNEYILLENKTVSVRPKENTKQQCRYDYDISGCNSLITKERGTYNTFMWFNGLVDDHFAFRSIKYQSNCSLKERDGQNELNRSKQIILDSGDVNTCCCIWNHKGPDYQDTNTKCMPKAKNDDEQQTYTTQGLRMTCDHDFSSYDLSLETDKIYPLNTKWKFSDRTNVCQEKCPKSSEMFETERRDLGCYVEYFDKMWEDIVQGISGYDIC